MTTIGELAFLNCTSLRNITIPGSVTSIGKDAFGNCTSLSSTYFEGDAPTLGDNVFFRADHATVYYLDGTQGWTSTVGGRPTMLWKPQIQTVEALPGAFALTLDARRQPGSRPSPGSNSSRKLHPPTSWTRTAFGADVHLG